jgi:SAM-dependent methyltransferase
MSIHFNRKKKTSFLFRVIYNLNKIRFMGQKRKLRLFLDLEWIFGRLAHEASFFHYSNLDHPIRTKGKSFLLNGINKENIVLDLGCNLGENAWLISQKAAEVTGIDFNASAIETADKQFKSQNLTFIQSEAITYLSSSKKQFDTLILSHILEHISDQRSFLMAHKAFFKRIYIELPDIESSFLNEYRADVNADFQYTDDDHVVEFDREDLQTLLKECGLKILSSEYIYGIQKYWCAVEK